MNGPKSGTVIIGHLCRISAIRATNNIIEVVGGGRIEKGGDGLVQIECRSKGCHGRRDDAGAPDDL